MDIKVSQGFRTDRLKLLRATGEHPYDYEREGILTKCLPKIFFNGNSVLVSFIQLIDMRLILLFKYIDRVKNFKNISSF